MLESNIVSRYEDEDCTALHAASLSDHSHQSHHFAPSSGAAPDIVSDNRSGNLRLVPDAIVVTTVTELSVVQ